MTEEFDITGMKCQGCADTVASKMQAIAGVTSATVDLAAKTATVSGGFDAAAVIASLDGTPYSAARK